jgi:hypothetical protein
MNRGEGAVLAVLLWLILIATPASGAETGPEPVSVRGDDLVAGGVPFKAIGFNYTYGASHPNIMYFNRPTQRRLLRVRRDFRKAAAVGVNTMRIYLELPTFMLSPTRSRRSAFLALRRVIKEAEREGLYLDITGNLVWHPGRDSAWYDGLSEEERWFVQARFWRQVARVAAPSPAVLIYELTSEPITCDPPKWYGGLLGDHFFAQCMVRRDFPSETFPRARRWTSIMRRTIRHEDKRHLVSIGMLPLPDDPFGYENLSSLLDVLVVHEYPESGRAGASIDVLRRVARQGRPVLLGEVFSLDPETYERFLRGAEPVLDGSLSFFDGRLPDDVHETTYADIFYRQNLTIFLTLHAPPAAAPAEGPAPAAQRRTRVTRSHPRTRSARSARTSSSPRPQSMRSARRLDANTESSPVPAR